MTKPGALLVAVIVWAATLIACSSKSAEPTSQPIRSSHLTSRANAERPHPRDFRASQLHRPSSQPECDTTMSWLSNAASPLMALTFSYKLDSGEYSMPLNAQPPNVEATA